MAEQASPGQAPEHAANVTTRLSAKPETDRYIPKCVCGWQAEPITAGKGGAQQRNWQRAWDIADAHVAAAARGVSG